MINHAMFQRNGRTGYVLKPNALRHPQKELFTTRTAYTLHVTVISAQQLPRPKDAFGHEIAEKSDLDPFVEVTVFAPDWPVVPGSKKSGTDNARVKGLKHRHSMPEVRSTSPTLPDAGMASTPSVPVTRRTAAVMKNGFNPAWGEHLQLSFDCVADMMDLIFVRFVVRQEEKDMDEPLGVYCVSLGSLQQGTPSSSSLTVSTMADLLFLLRLSPSPVT
jgi:phosphatidylinositol phospholipase C delta